jgi:hypothetical protein
MANSLESRCQSSCQMVVRWLSELLSKGCCQRASVRVTAVRELLSGLLSEWLLSEWLLSESFCQRASVRVAAVRVKVSD